MEEFRLATRSLRGPIWFYSYFLPEPVVLDYVTPMLQRRIRGPVLLSVDISFEIYSSGSIIVRNAVPATSWGSEPGGNAIASYGEGFEYRGPLAKSSWVAQIERALREKGLDELLTKAWENVQRWRSMPPSDRPACRSSIRVIEELHGHLAHEVTESEARVLIDFLNAHVVSCPYCRERIPCSDQRCGCCGSDLSAMRVTVSCR